MPQDQLPCNPVFHRCRESQTALLDPVRRRESLQNYVSLLEKLLDEVRRMESAHQEALLLRSESLDKAS